MKKIVFLPCSPDMWDGFQTLWEDAVKDDDNLVTVIPIPTYKRDVNNQLSDAMYITEGYPGNVPVTDVNAYIFESERPDIIYIQNAQDTQCLAFCVHPFFHTSNLKQFTDNLIYVPYSCHYEEDLGDPQYKNFFIPQNIDNIDHIIVQSEGMKEAYLNYIASTNASKYDLWKNKISWEDYPRTNILKRYTKTNVPHSSDWDNYLSDNKETHLLCTSIFNVLYGNRPLLKEVQQTLARYNSQKASTLLIWRPHRQMQEVLEKLRPELVKDYQQLLEYFTSNNIGILDTTPSPTAAIVLSDKYIGDNCGILELYKSTGKPISETVT